MNEELLLRRLYYPRVSQIYEMYTAGSYGMINPDVLRRAQERGTRVHVYCTAYAKGYPFNDAVDPECAPYVRTFIKWYEENVEEVVFFPTRLYDDVREFCGEPDFVFKLKNRDGLFLVDLKTSVSVQKFWVVQLGAYIHLLNVNNIKVSQGFNLRLRNDENKKPLIDNEGDCSVGWNIFSNCLSNYDYFVRPKGLIYDVA